MLFSVTEKSRLYGYQHSSVMYVLSNTKFSTQGLGELYTGVYNASFFKIYFIYDHQINFYIPFSFYL